MTRKRRKKRLWSYAEGRYGTRVTVFERTPGGPIYGRVYDPSLRGGRGGYQRISLKHRDRDRAEAWAAEQHAKLKAGLDAIGAGRTTLARLFALYRTHRTPRKTSGEQGEDDRRMEMWTRHLGAGKDPHEITLEEWERFIDARTSCAIDARGKLVAAGKQRPVGNRTVEADCEWLGSVLRWGTEWRRDGRYLLRENCVRGYETPTEKNPKRPVATQDRYEAIRAVSHQVTMEVRWNGTRRAVRSYLSELLDIVHGTGRRISAVCQLRYDDLRLNASRHGAIDRILTERPGIGAAYLFPSPIDSHKPIRYELASAWLMETERLAGVDKQDGSLWHAYRRKWATERKHLPDVDVAAAGGWKETTSLKRCYQQADEATMLEVVLGGGELRERKA
jgi:hypothetical protein